MPTSDVLNISTMEFDENAQELAQLVQKAQAGSEAAFGQVYDLLFQKIYRFIFYRVGHKEVAEDLAEEVFIKAYGKLSALDKPEVFLGWIYRIARNTVIDYYREKKLTVSLEDVENTLEYETNTVDLLQLEYEQAVLLKLLKELGAEQQTVIKLKFLEDLSNAEIASILNKTEGAIRVIQHRAITKLLELKKLQEKP